MNPADMVLFSHTSPFVTFEKIHKKISIIQDPWLDLPASVLGAGWPLSRGGGTSQELCRTASSSCNILLCPQTQLLQEVGCPQHKVTFII